MSNKKVTKGGFNGYVDTRRPTKKELGEAEKQFAVAGEGFTAVAECCEAGYNFSIKYDEKRGAYKAELFGRESGINDGYILSSYAGSIERAIILTLHKHYNHFNQGKWEYENIDDWA